MTPTRRSRTIWTLPLGALLASLAVAAVAPAKTSHEFWPKIDGTFKKAKGKGVQYYGTAKSDELLGRHGSDTIKGRDGSDVLWGDWDPKGQPGSQHDRIDGEGGTDFIYGSHGRNTIRAGAGNDVISIHYGRGSLDCGPGRDIYHVPKSLKKKYKIKNCEKVEYRSESKRGALKPLD